MVKNLFIANDEEKNEIMLYLSHKKYPSNFSETQKRMLRRKCKNISLINGIIRIMDGGKEKEVILRSESAKREQLIMENHKVDHARSRAVFNRLREAYFGVTANDVDEVLKRCNNCIRETPPAFIESITPIIPSYPRERLIVDTVDLSVYSHQNNGFKYIFTMIDSFTKFGWVYSAPNKNSETFSSILRKHFYKEGTWELFHTDNGGEFINNNVKEVLDYFKISSIHGRPYHPQSQGQVERFNRTIKSRIRKCFEFNQFDWYNHIDRIVYYYNNTAHRSTGMKPFVLFKGFDSELLNNMNASNHSEEAKLQLMNYVETYRRELSLRNSDLARVNDKVLLVKPYNPVARRRALESIYFNEVYIVQEINGESVLIESEATNENKQVSIRCLKKIH